jgi:hypothetical protein
VIDIGDFRQFSVTKFPFFLTGSSPCDVQRLKRLKKLSDGLLLEGGHYWTPTMYIRLAQDLGLDSEVAIHLAETYGDRAFAVGKMEH